MKRVTFSLFLPLISFAHPKPKKNSEKIFRTKTLLFSFPFYKKTIYFVLLYLDIIALKTLKLLGEFDFFGGL